MCTSSIQTGRSLKRGELAPHITLATYVVQVPYSPTAITYICPIVIRLHCQILTYGVKRDRHTEKMSIVLCLDTEMVPAVSSKTTDINVEAGVA